MIKEKENDYTILMGNALQKLNHGVCIKDLTYINEIASTHNKCKKAKCKAHKETSLL